MSDVIDEIRRTFRSLYRRRRHSATVILLVTISVAATAAVFPVFNGFLLRPLPFPDPERLVDIDETAPQWNLPFLHIAWPDFVQWRADNTTFESMAVYRVGGINYEGNDEPQRVDAITASYELPRVLGLEPILGRTFVRDDDHADAAPVVLLTESFWRREFDADPAVIGRSVRLEAQPFEIVGVLPAQADFLAPAAVWRPTARPDDDTSGWNLKGVGRLLPGATIEQARADLLRIHRSRVEERDVNAITAPVVNRFSDRYLGDYQAISWLLMAAVGLVLMIACVNIGGLMLAQSLARSGEVSMRLALGAGRGRIVRQLFMESVLLALAGGVAGVGIGIWMFKVLVLPRADQFPAWVTFDLDWRFALFTLAVTGGTAAAFGLWPARRAARGDAAESLRSAESRLAGSRLARRTIDGLVVAEVAMAVGLLIAAGVALQDVRYLQSMDPGYRAEGLLSYKVQLRGERFVEGDDYRGFINRHAERLAELPGVTRVGATSHLPLTREWGWFFVVEGRPPLAEGESNPVVQHKVVTPGYLETMGIELLAGRTFEANDGVGEREPVIVVNESFARHFFPDGQDPIGQRVGDGGEDQWKTIIGVTRDVRHRGMTIDTRPGVYQPMSQYWMSTVYFVLRTGAADPYALLEPARALLRDMDATLPMYEITTVSDRLADNLWTRRQASWLMLCFSSVALLLAATGLYGMISYGVRQRLREFAIRMALGAEKRHIVGGTLRRGSFLVGLGTVAGVGAALAASRLLSRVMVRSEPLDVGVVAIVVLGVATVAAIANLLPALRASRAEPVTILRGK